MRRSFLNRPRAFLLMDMMLALGIATAVLLSLSVAVGTYRRAERRMADTRALNRHLDEALLTLQSGGKADPDLALERLGNGPANHVWVRLSIRPGTPSTGPQSGVEPGKASQGPGTPAAWQPGASLVGLIPADKAVGGAP